MDKTALVAVVDSSKRRMRPAAESRAGDAAPEGDGERDWEESVPPFYRCWSALHAKVNFHMSYSYIKKRVYGR